MRRLLVLLTTVLAAAACTGGGADRVNDRSPSSSGVREGGTLRAVIPLNAGVSPLSEGLPSTHKPIIGPTPSKSSGVACFGRCSPTRDFRPQRVGRSSGRTLLRGCLRSLATG